MTDKKIKYNTITHAHTDTRSYKHTYTLKYRYNHGASEEDDFNYFYQLEKLVTTGKWK